jgi:hypothetical protein
VEDILSSVNEWAHLSELEETIKNWVEDVLSSVNKRTQNLCEELNVKIEEMQLGLQAVMMSLIADTMKDIHEDLDLRIQGTQVEIETMKTLVETMWHGLKTRQGEVKAQAWCGSCSRTGTNVGIVQPPKFNRLTSWAMF